MTRSSRLHGSWWSWRRKSKVAEASHYNELLQILNEHQVEQIGVAPLRIDILTAVTGVQFCEAWRNRVEGIIAGVPVHFISLDDLIVNKQALGRPSDLAQLESIQKEMRKKK